MDQEDTLKNILHQVHILLKTYDTIRSKGNSLRTTNDREFALVNDSIRGLKRLMFIYDSQKQVSDLQEDI